jgi:hypothetical protein
MLLNEAMRRALSPFLFDFCCWMSGQGHPPPSVLGARRVAELFRSFANLPQPIAISDMTDLLRRLGYDDVFLIPGLEKTLGGARGHWGISKNKDGKDIIRTVIEAGRPSASRIKTVEHELYEQILVVSEDIFPNPPRLNKKQIEREADLFAAVLKLPVNDFLRDVEDYGIDLPKLTQKNLETLGCATRHIRDFVMPNRPFYFCRMSIERHPDRRCPDLMHCLEESNGLCVFIQDAVKTKSVSRHRNQTHPLPGYNVSQKYEYCVIHPFFRRYAASGPGRDLPPVFIPRLDGWASHDVKCPDLFGWRDLSIMVYPIGKKKVTGFYLVAVHPKDICLFDGVRNTVPVNHNHGIDWMFSAKRVAYSRNDDADDLDEIYAADMPQPAFEFSFLSDAERAELADDEKLRQIQELEKQATRWPGASHQDSDCW